MFILKKLFYFYPFSRTKQLFAAFIFYPYVCIGYLLSFLGCFQNGRCALPKNCYHPFFFPYPMPRNSQRSNDIIACKQVGTIAYVGITHEANRYNLWNVPDRQKNKKLQETHVYSSFYYI